MEHCWPNKNIILKHCNTSWTEYFTNPKMRKNVILLLLPLVILFLFALSQAGTSLFLLTRFGFSHPVAFLFAGMVCICLTCVYFQKISVNFAKSYYNNKTYYKAYKDLFRSFNSTQNPTNSENHFEKIRIMWMLLQHRHIMANFIAKTDMIEDKDVDNWFSKQVKLAQYNLGGEAFKLTMYSKGEDIYKWSLACIKLEKRLKTLFKDHDITDDVARKKIRSILSLYNWRCLEKTSDNTKDIIALLFKVTKKVQKKDWIAYFKDAKICEDHFLNAVDKHQEDNSWLEKIRYQRINIDHKLYPDPDLFFPARWLSRFGGLGNMLVGNNLLGLYGSIAGVAALISFYPIIHLSIAVKILVAIFGCVSAAFASYALTWPMLEKLLKQFTRWRMRRKARKLLSSKNNLKWLIVRPIDWRIVVCFIFAGVVTISAVNFNMYATWHLSNRLIALFSGTWLARYLTHMPMMFKVILTAFQCVISFLCAGSVYLTSCFNQYVGHTGKTKLRFISVVDKILKHIKQKSWSKVAQLAIIVACSITAAIAQTIIWFHGLTTSPIVLLLLAFPASLAFFATFCEAALACLDSESDPAWVSNQCVKEWQALTASKLNNHQSDDSDLNSSNNTVVSSVTVSPEEFGLNKT